MKKYKSNIGIVFGWRFIRHLFLIKFLMFLFGFLVMLGLVNSNLIKNIYDEVNFVFLTFLYFISTIIYLRLTNHNFIFHEDKIEIEPSIFKNIRKKIFYYKEIKEVTLKHEIEFLDKNLLQEIMEFVWFLFFPLDYKWINIKTKSNKSFTFLCFGFEYDYYENCDSDQLMENIFYSFAQKNIKVYWTKTRKSYFTNMNKWVENVQSTS